MCKLHARLGEPLAIFEKKTETMTLPTDYDDLADGL